MKLTNWILILPAAALLAGCGQTEQQLSEQTANQLANPALTAQPDNLVVYPDDRPSIPDGGALYKQQCASCHTGGGGTTSGAPVTGQSTTPDMMQSANAAPPAGGAAEHSAVAFDQHWANATKPIDIYRTIAFGKTEKGKEHPKFSGKFGQRDMWNLVVYTRSIGQPALTTKQIDEITPIFGANCAVCHGTKGDGDGPLMRNLEPAPANFQRFERFFNRSDDVLFDHIANGIRWEGMPNFLNKKDSKKGITFDQAYIKKLVQYVRKFQINQDPVMSVASATNTGNNTITTTDSAEDTTAPTPLTKKSGEPK